jgi:hypothetical protein
VLEAVFVLLEFSSPSRRIFIGSHSLPPSLVRRIGPSFILKKGTLDKFESRSSDVIFLGYASHSRAFCVLNLDTNLVMETCEVTFDETQPCNSSVFECVGDDEVGKKIFEDEEDDAGEDDGDDAEAPATRVPSTSTTTTTVQDGPSPTPPTIQ